MIEAGKHMIRMSIDDSDTYVAAFPLNATASTSHGSQTTDEEIERAVVWFRGYLIRTLAYLEKRY